MECNKEEAFRSKKIAEAYMLKNDFLGALRFAQRAQRLFPDLENVSQLLAVCEVHCSAEKRLGAEQDWYGILQIEKSADEITIKKQYRKLALLLHPDKNKLVGSETAFKLIGEAYRILADRAKRSLYDIKLRSLANNGLLQKPPPPYQSNEKSSVLKSDGASSNSGKSSNLFFSHSNAVRKEGVETFWTKCPTCQVKYEYYKTYLNSAMLCQTCRKPFKAFQYIEGAGAGAAACSQREPDTAMKDTSGGGSPKVTSRKFMGNPSDPLRKDRFEEFLTKAKGSADNGASSESQKDVNRNANRKDDVGKIPKADVRKLENASDLKTGSRKRERDNYPIDSGRTSDKISGKANVENGDSYGQADSDPNLFHPNSRSMGTKQHVYYCKDTDHDDSDYPVNLKNPRSSDAGEGEGSMQKNVDSSAAAGDKNERKSNDPNVGSTSEIGKEVSPEVMLCPDAEFNDFEKDKQQGCFAVNQVWAIYDQADGMPRYYARVRKVFSPEFKLKITWFEADPDEKNQDEVNWCNENLPVACGRYIYGESEETKDHLMFSHQITYFNGIRRGTFMVYPRKGETWALFTNWDIKWSSNPKKHVSFKYEFVEVLSDIVEDRGIAVAYLVKVKGFVSLFQQMKVKSFQIPRHELYRFSHCIPSFRMTGRERKGVPEGSFELDPAALPSEVTTPSTETGGACASSAFKDQSKHPRSSENVGSPKKPRKSNLQKEPLQVRSSPRGLSKLNQTNSDSATAKGQSQNMEEAQKGKGSSTSRSKINTPTKHSRKGPDQDILTVRRSPRSLQRSK